MSLIIDDLRAKNLILFESISGSNAYGLALPHSDVDIKGVFYLPKTLFYGMDYTEQVSNESNDIVFYELGKFFELLLKNNPGVLELLNMPQDCVLHKHPLFALIRTEMFLSKLCKDTFAGYAMTQVAKARGLNKKISNPMSEERKSVLDFCYVPYGQGSVGVKEWLHMKGLQQEYVGLVSIPHIPNAYHMFYSNNLQGKGYKGIIQKENSNDVSVSSVPKDEAPIAVLTFNKDGYTKFCRDYNEYWDWVAKRNKARYETAISHGKNYDSKNMMHTFRLMGMAKDIALKHEIVVRRPDREYLLEIRAGKYEYEKLLQRAEQDILELQKLYAGSNLQDKPDEQRVNDLLVTIREQLYKE